MKDYVRVYYKTLEDMLLDNELNKLMLVIMSGSFDVIATKSNVQNLNGTCVLGDNELYVMMNYTPYLEFKTSSGKRLIICCDKDRGVKINNKILCNVDVDNVLLFTECIEKTDSGYAFGIEMSGLTKIGIITDKDLNIKKIYIKSNELFQWLTHEDSGCYSDYESVLAQFKSHRDIYYRVSFSNYNDFLEDKRSCSVLDPRDMALEIYDDSELLDKLALNGFILANINTAETMYFDNRKLRVSMFGDTNISFRKGKSYMDIEYNSKGSISLNQEVLVSCEYLLNRRLLIVSGVLIFEDCYEVMLASLRFKLVLFLDRKTLELTYFLYSGDCLTVSDEFRGMYNKSRLLL